MQKREAWRAWRRNGAAGLLAGAALFLLPLLLMGGAGTPESAAVLPPSPAAVTPGPAPALTPEPGADGARTVRVLQPDGAVEEQTMDEYLWSVTAAEMPASFEPDALRAQAVCARTYTLWQTAHPGRHEGADVCTDSSCCQAYITKAQAAARWGALAEQYTAKITAAVADTSGIAALYGGAPIQAVFFSSSAGPTEDAVEVWGSALPYLTSVSSPEGDADVPNYRAELTMADEQVRSLVSASCPGADLSGAPEGWFSDFTYTASGRVDTVKVGGVTLSGGAARGLFSLRSAAFGVEHGEDGFTFTTVGYGHGVGLSQYGANAMAKSGSTWREILEHYYTGATLGPGW